MPGLLWQGAGRVFTALQKGVTSNVNSASLPYPMLRPFAKTSKDLTRDLTPTSEKWQRRGLVLGHDRRRPEQDHADRVVEGRVRCHADHGSFLAGRPPPLGSDQVERAEQEQAPHHVGR